MSPLTLNSPSQQPPEDFAQLLESLASRPQPAVVHYDAETGDRVELSGRVLANWAIKLIGLLRDEYDIEDEPVGESRPLVVLDMATHWKAAALVLAASALGAEVQLMPSADDAAEVLRASLVVTDHPSAWLDSEALGEADLAVISHGMLDASFTDATGLEVPAWVLDISAEVRQHPDRLNAPLPVVPLPRTPQEHTQQEPSSPMVVTAWAKDTAQTLLQTWAQQGTVVLFQGAPEGETWKQMLSNEGLA